jgi:hypothetical protein
MTELKSLVHWYNATFANDLQVLWCIGEVRVIGWLRNMVKKMVREMVNFRGSECGVRMSYFVDVIGLAISV